MKGCPPSSLERLVFSDGDISSFIYASSWDMMALRRRRSITTSDLEGQSLLRADVAAKRFTPHEDVIDGDEQLSGAGRDGNAAALAAAQAKVLVLQPAWLTHRDMCRFYQHPTEGARTLFGDVTELRPAAG
jgi:hypothetical protein